MRTPTRVLLADMPRITRELVKSALEGQDDLEVVEDAADGEPLPARCIAADADIVVVASWQRKLSLDALRVFDERPHTRVIVIVNGGNEAVLHELRPHASVDAELSPERLLALVRETRRRREVAYS